AGVRPGALGAPPQRAQWQSPPRPAVRSRGRPAPAASQGAAGRADGGPRRRPAAAPHRSPRSPQLSRRRCRLVVRRVAPVAARPEGVLLDPVYTAKAMAALVDRARHRSDPGPVIFLRSGGVPALFAYAEELAL